MVPKVSQMIYEYDMNIQGFYGVCTIQFIHIHNDPDQICE